MSNRLRCSRGRWSRWCCWCWVSPPRRYRGPRCARRWRPAWPRSRRSPLIFGQIAAKQWLSTQPEDARAGAPVEPPPHRGVPPQSPSKRTGEEGVPAIAQNPQRDEADPQHDDLYSDRTPVRIGELRQECQEEDRSLRVEDVDND